MTGGFQLVMWVPPVIHPAIGATTIRWLPRIPTDQHHLESVGCHGATTGASLPGEARGIHPSSPMRNPKREARCFHVLVSIVKGGTLQVFVKFLQGIFASKPSNHPADGVSSRFFGEEKRINSIANLARAMSCSCAESDVATWICHGAVHGRVGSPSSQDSW